MRTASPVLDASAGDVNGDRRVDLNDLSLVLSQFGFGAAADVNYDGVTDLADLTIVLAQFGLSDI